MSAIGINHLELRLHNTCFLSSWLLNCHNRLLMILFRFLNWIICIKKAFYSCPFILIQLLLYQSIRIYLIFLTILNISFFFDVVNLLYCFDKFGTLALNHLNLVIVATISAILNLYRLRFLFFFFFLLLIIILDNSGLAKLC